MDGRKQQSVILFKVLQVQILSPLPTIIFRTLAGAPLVALQNLQYNISLCSGLSE